MTSVIVLAWIVGYVVAGALYARSQALACQRRAEQEWGGGDSARESVHLQLGWRVAAWPYALVFDAVRVQVRAWITAPITARDEQVEQLRTDARAWDEKRHTGTPEERAMAGELAKLCRERARDLAAS